MKKRQIKKILGLALVLGLILTTITIVKSINKTEGTAQQTVEEPTQEPTKKETNYFDYHDNIKLYQVNPITLDKLGELTTTEAVNKNDSNNWYIDSDKYQEEKSKRNKYIEQVNAKNNTYTDRSYVHKELNEYYVDNNKVTNMGFFSLENLKYSNDLNNLKIDIYTFY